jgi:Tol biopolymer transport system component
VKVKARTSLLSNHFDLFVGFIVLILLGILTVVVIRGDQIGIEVKDYLPTTRASSMGAVHIGFEEAIDPASVASRITLAPPVSGQISVSDKQVIFQPDAVLTPGQIYTVIVHPGITTISGRRLQKDFQWQFDVRAPRVAYLGPVDQMSQNLYLVNTTRPDSPLQLTRRTNGILSYDVSPDGSKIVFSQMLEDGSGSVGLFLWDSSNGEATLWLDCKNATCNNPSWRPDGSAIAYEYANLNLGTGMPPGTSRIWVLDFASNTAGPLFGDTQTLGYWPTWSLDGTMLGAYDVDIPGIIIHDFARNRDIVIPTDQGEIGKFSPDGKWLFFPKIVNLDETNFVTHLVLADLTADPPVLHDLIPDNSPVNDVNAVWQPDSKGLIVLRRPSSSQKGKQGSQIYRFDLESGEKVSLLDDNRYVRTELTLDPTGQQLAFMSLAIGTQDAYPEVWVYDLNSHTQMKVADKANSPRWMP